MKVAHNLLKMQCRYYTTFDPGQHQTSESHRFSRKSPQLLPKCTHVFLKSCPQ